MLPLPSASKLYEMAQNNGWGDTSMGESQWIANQKNTYGGSWRRTVHNKIINMTGSLLQADTPKTPEPPKENPQALTDTTKYPWERPFDEPVSWQPKELIKNKTQCMNQLDLVRCRPEDRFVRVDRTAYDKYGFADDGTPYKDVPMFKYKKTGQGPTLKYVERTQAEIDGLNATMDSWCDKIVKSCRDRFDPKPTGGTTPPPPTPTPAPTTTPTAKVDEEETFIQKYKYPLIAAGVILLAVILMRKQSQPTVIVTK